MLISALVISCCYLCYEIINKQYFIYKKVNEQIRQMVVLEILLNMDICQSNKIYKHGDEEILLTTPTESKQYLFASDYIIRIINTSRDTFFIAPFNLQFKFQNEHQNINTGLIDELSFESLIFNESENFHYKKSYSADVLMEVREEELRIYK